MTDLLRFNDGPAAGTIGWNGPWPPPDTFVVLVGRSTGRVAHVGHPDELARADDAWPTVAWREDYRLRSASRLPPMPDNSHVARGAEYDWVPPETDEP